MMGWCGAELATEVLYYQKYGEDVESGGPNVAFEDSKHPVRLRQWEGTVDQKKPKVVCVAIQSCK